MQVPHIKILLTKAKLHVFYYVDIIKNLKYYVVIFIAFTTYPLTLAILYYRMQVGLKAREMCSAYLGNKDTYMCTLFLVSQFLLN
jgi:hypothetical protein